MSAQVLRFPAAASLAPPMTGLYWAMIGVGSLLCVLAVVWSVRTQHIRALWRTSRHNASTVAIVLELEERVQELETPEMSPSVR